MCSVAGTPFTAAPSTAGITSGELAAAVLGAALAACGLGIVLVHCYYRRRITRGDFSRLEEVRLPPSASAAAPESGGVPVLAAPPSGAASAEPAAAATELASVRYAPRVPSSAAACVVWCLLSVPRFVALFLPISCD